MKHNRNRIFDLYDNVTQNKTEIARIIFEEDPSTFKDIETLRLLDAFQKRQ